ncbi:hypothetical protein IPP75_01085 [Candidatus Saccharibacteria bacterium]|nr:MAG: hypothetical protein IPP75_01085 [Candidatus Saccharibacteria bacterium]
MAWAAHPSRKAEASDLFTIPIIQMGARVYLPTLGRFLQVDPIEGGTANAYVYALDPINQSDYSGMFVFAIAAAVPFIAAAAVVAATAVISSPSAVRARQGAAKSIANAVDNTWNKIGASLKSQAQPKAITNPVAPPKQCNTYTLAPPPYAGVKYPSASASNYAQKQAAITSTQSLLAIGISPGGFPIMGSGQPKRLDNPLYANGWTKYSVPYPANDFEVHYNLNTITCQYADLKTKEGLY